MPESEDRPLAPSRRRRQLARERGFAPHSPELTAAVGLLVGVILLGAWGGDLARDFTGLLRSAGDGAAPADAQALAARVREAAFGVLVPLGAILGGVLVAVVAAHQAQVGGLWAPARLAPDAGRLWNAGTEAEPGAWVLRGLESVARIGVLLAVAAGTLGARAPDLARLGALETPDLLRASAAIARDLALALAVAWVVLGLIDFGLRWRAFEQRLRMTPEEHREEQKAIDGDPALRSRRLQIARSWLRDPGELLAGAALVVTGPAGLTVLLAGSPPPGRVGVRTIARGVAASTLRHAAERAGVPVVRAERLARWFAGSRIGRPALPPTLAAELAAAWPRAPRRGAG
jgi:flagellar biosynthetic protein FlhB